MKLRPRLAGIVVGVLLATTQAAAQSIWPDTPGVTTPLVPGQLFIGLGGEMGVHNLPTFESPGRSAALNTGPVATDVFRPSFNPDPTVAGGGGGLGYVFHDGTFPAWMGENVRIAFWGHYWDGDFTQNDLRPGGMFGASPAAYFSVAPVDGSPGSTVGVIGVGGMTRVTRFEVDTNGYNLSLPLTSDFDVAPNVTLSPFAALVGGHARDSYSQTSTLVTNLDSGIYALNEWVSTDRIGAVFGTGMTLRVAEPISLHLGGLAGFVATRAKLTGADCFAGALNSATGTPCLAATPGPGAFQTTVTDKRSTVDFRGGLMGGITWNMIFAELSLTGFASYDSKVAGVANPVVTSPITTTGNGNQPTSGPAQLKFDGETDYGGMVMLRAPLNAPGQ